MTLYSGVGITVPHITADRTEQILFGLQKISNEYTDDGLPYGYGGVAITHVIEFLQSFLPSTITVTAQFPKFTTDNDGNLVSEVKTPTVVVRGVCNFSQELGIGRTLWETEQGEIKGFNQAYYVEFHIYSKSQMKTDQLLDQISLQLQIQKSTGGHLHRLGFQNFQTVSTESGRGFRYGSPWDFRMQHQFPRFFHSILTVRTSFDVVWEDRSDSVGIIHTIVFNEGLDFPSQMVLGISLETLLLEQKFLGWHNPNSSLLL